MSMSSPETSLSIAVDIGGTFTDISLLDRATGQVWRAKTPSVPDDPSEAFMTGIKLALADAGAPATALDQVLHGTTVATNMILEGKGARSALVTTRGFRHVLAIGRQDIPRKANLYTWVKPERPVPASRIVEIDERLAAGGSVIVPLDEESVLKAAEAIRRMDVGAVGICLIHAFANPEHERRTAEILRSELPGIAVTMSTDVLPVVREYERSLTTVLNAALMPGVTTYVGRLEQRLNEEEVRAPVQRWRGRSGSDPASACLDGPVGPGRRGGRRSRDRRRLRHQ
jgi:N-methylhydantoinase A